MFINSELLLCNFIIVLPGIANQMKDEKKTTSCTCNHYANKLC